MSVAAWPDAKKHDKKDVNKLRRWAGQGKWMAVSSTPEILDSDGVPALDLVFVAPDPKTGRRPRKVTGPSDGTWYDPLVQFLDLPTGELRVVYCDEFFHDGFDQNEDVDVIADATTSLQDGRWNQSFSTMISCEPGFYQASAFTRFSDEMSDVEPPEGSAEL
ncbi:MAG: hypothetical protein WBD31_13070, partial [Rubripirellula sp.]